MFACVCVLYSLPAWTLSSFFCYTHTQPAEPNLPAHVFTTQQSLCRSRGGFAGVGGEFTEAFSRSLPREPFLGRIWNIGSPLVDLYFRTSFTESLDKENVSEGMTEVDRQMLRISLVETRVRLCRCFSFGPRTKFLAVSRSILLSSPLLLFFLLFPSFLVGEKIARFRKRKKRNAMSIVDYWILEMVIGNEKRRV